jgi:membrane protease YdiL (CAAX protease family)
LQVLLAWILAIIIGQTAYGLLVPPHIEGDQQVVDANQTVTTVTFLPDNRYRAKTGVGTFQFKGQDRTTLILTPDKGEAVTMKFAGTARDRVGLIAINMVFVQGAAITLVLLLLFKHRLRWRDAFGGLGEPAWTVAMPVLLGTLFILPAFGLHFLSQLIMEQLLMAAHRFEHVQLLEYISKLIIYVIGDGPTPQHAVQMVSAASNHAEIALQVISVVLLAPVAEELLFRGIIYTSLKEAGHPVGAVLVSSLIFGAVHGSLALMLPLTVLAVVLVWLYEKTGSIIAPIIMHATFNAINFALIKLAPNLAP